MVPSPLSSRSVNITKKIELEIPNWNCLNCIWEKMATDDEVDPKDEEYDDDWYAK